MQLLICSQTCILAVSLQESHNHMFVRELCRKKIKVFFYSFKQLAQHLIQNTLSLVTKIHVGRKKISLEDTN